MMEQRAGRSKLWIQIYSIYTFLKYVSAALFLLGFAIHRKHVIQSHYSSIRVCEHCYHEAQQHPDTFFEFGLCSIKYMTPNATSPRNLLTTARWWSASYGYGSLVQVYDLYAGLTFILVGVVCICLLMNAFPRLFCQFEDMRPGLFTEALVATFTFVCVFLFVIDDNEIFQLFQKDGCYVSAWGKPYIMGETAFAWAFLGCLVLLEFVRCLDRPLWVGFAFLAVFSILLAYTAFSMLLSYVNYVSSGDRTHFIFNCVLLMTLLEIPYCVCGPRIRQEYEGFLRQRNIPFFDQAWNV